MQRDVRPVSSLDEFREERAIVAKKRFDEAWSNRAQDWRALERALDELDVAVCALVSAREGGDAGAVSHLLPLDERA